MIVFTGESHLGAIRRGGTENPALTYWPLGAGGEVPTQFFRHAPETSSLHTTVKGWRNRVYSRETLTFDGSLALVALSLPLNTSRILRDYSWGTHVPWHLQKTQEETPLSDAVIQSLCEQDYRYAIAFIAALRDYGIPVVVLEGPHFFEHASYLKTRRFDVCSYIDATYRKAVRTKLAEMNVDVIEQRPETLTALGATKAAYKHENPKDSHHANAKFGALVFKDLVGYAEKADFL